MKTQPDGYGPIRYVRNQFRYRLYPNPRSKTKSIPMEKIIESIINDPVTMNKLNNKFVDLKDPSVEQLQELLAFITEISAKEDLLPEGDGFIDLRELQRIYARINRCIIIKFRSGLTSF
tara:strand:- start:1716 stop:2072 length:357 start_codon:yes stop_codon:yes gene_type:complete